MNDMLHFDTFPYKSIHSVLLFFLSWIALAVTLCGSAFTLCDNGCDNAGKAYGCSLFLPQTDFITMNTLSHVHS